jgi:hypothetical protein
MDAETETFDVATLVGFSDSSGDVLFGKVRGFPVGFKLIDPFGAPLGLFHVRHPFEAKSRQVESIQLPSDASQLVAEKQLEIEHQDRTAWLSFINCRERLIHGEVRSILDRILEAFANSGLSENADLCHYCRRETVSSLTCIDGKVAQICPACLKARLEPEQEKTSTRRELMPALLLVGLAACVGALVWTFFWIGYELLFSSLNTNVVFVPRLLEAIALVCVAGGTGGPVGYVVKRMRAGKRLSLILACAGTSAAILLGEVAFAVWLIFHEFQIVDIGVAWRNLPAIELNSGIFHLGVKVCALVFAAVIAIEIAKPPKRKVSV